MKRGENVLLVTLPYAKRVSLERTYLLGEFGVAVSGEETKLVPAPASVGFDDITRIGFPFFSGVFRYEIPFASSGGELTLVVPHYRGALVAVDLDGERVGRVVYPPYRLSLGAPAAGKHTLTLSLFVSRHEPQKSARTNSTPSRRTRILCNMSHDETHFRATKKAAFTIS